MLRVLVTSLLLLAAVPPAAAEVRIMSSPGGQIGQYLNLFAMVRQSGERVVIDGPCLSACTLVLSVVPKNRICVTRKAILGFHAAWDPDRRGRAITNAEATRLMLASYPAPVRRWIVRRGGLTAKTLLLRGRELRGMYRVCT
jgi:hypothetical protein